MPSIFNLIILALFCNHSTLARWTYLRLGISFFLGLGFILAMILRDRKIFDFFAVIVMLACGTELIQIYIDGRTPLFSDVLIDISGGLLGIALAKLFCFKKNQPLPD